MAKDRRKVSPEKASVQQGNGAEKAVPGPSSNPATNLLLTDIALRAGLHVGRRFLERRLLGRHFTAEQAKRMVKGRPASRTLLSAVVAQIASRSLPGAMLIGGGLFAKMLYDRRKSARAAEAEGLRDLASDAENA